MSQGVKKQPVYSDAPSPLDTSTLSSTRFIDTESRRYPYRDGAGRVNINLINASLAEAEVDRAAAVVDTLSAWQRHCVRALKRRPADEQMTLDELVDGGSPEHRRSSGAAETQPPREPPRTVTNRQRRLFSAPAPDHEPRFDLDDSDGSPGADRLYLCQLADEVAGRRSTPRKHATRKQPATTREAAAASSSSHKRGRLERSPTRPPPGPPLKAARPIARALSHRQAALEMRTSRLFGFGGR